MIILYSAMSNDAVGNGAIEEINITIIIITSMNTIDIICLDHNLAI